MGNHMDQVIIMLTHIGKVIKLIKIWKRLMMSDNPCRSTTENLLKLGIQCLEKVANK